MADESLFSLEVVIEFLKNIVVPCTQPAIAFRLLDFPTLIIKQDEKNANVDDGTYRFYSGKSCLFKMNRNTLLSNLGITPLFVMLVDVYGGKAKLLASTTISLLPCFKEVLDNIEMNGLDVPVVRGKEGIFELYNLMGTPVALTKLYYRIFSLGGTINGHVKCAQPLGKVTADVKTVNAIKKVEEIDINSKPQEFDKEVKHTSHATIETQTDRYCEDLRSIHEQRQNHFVQSEVKKNKRKLENVNITRPPPLFYNSRLTPDIPHRTTTPEERTKITNIDIRQSEITQAESEFKLHSVSVQTEKVVASCTPEPVMPQVRQDPTKRTDFLDLPIINALLRELTIAQQNRANCIDQESCEINTINEKDSIPKQIPEQKLAKSSKARKNVPQVVMKKPSSRAVKTTNSKSVLIQRNPIKFTKSTLKYGTTRTQRLREAMNKQGKQVRDVKQTSQLDKDVDKQKFYPHRHSKIPEEPITKGFNDNLIKTREMSCQVTPNNTRIVTEDDLASRKDIGVQVMSCDMSHVSVQQSDFVQFNKEDVVTRLSQEKENESQDSILEKFPSIGFPDKLAQASELNHVSPRSHKSEWSSYSRKTTPHPDHLSTVEPTFSQFSPTPKIKNSRYNKTEAATSSLHSSSSSTHSENETQSETELVDKPTHDLSNVSSIHQQYSSDNFDSLNESDHNSTSDDDSNIDN